MIPALVAFDVLVVVALVVAAVATGKIRANLGKLRTAHQTLAEVVLRIRGVDGCDGCRETERQIRGESA